MASFAKMPEAIEDKDAGDVMPTVPPSADELDAARAALANTLPAGGADLAEVVAPVLAPIVGPRAKHTAGKARPPPKVGVARAEAGKQDDLAKRREGVARAAKVKKDNLAKRKEMARAFGHVLCIEKAPFARLVREVVQDTSPTIRFQDAAFQILHISAETALVDLFTRANLLTLHGRRKTLMIRDLQLVEYLVKGERLEDLKETVVQHVDGAPVPMVPAPFAAELQKSRGRPSRARASRARASSAQPSVAA